MNIKQVIEKITNNWPVKLVCFALAIVLYILHQASMIEKRTFIVPLTVIQEGNVTHVGNIEKNVSVVVRSSPEYINVIQPTDFMASINLNSATGNAEYPVTITLSDAILSIDPLEIQVKPDRINVKVEEKVLKYVEVKPSIVENVAYGYRIDKITCDPPYVEIIGPKSVVEGINEIYTKRIPCSNATSSFTAETSYYELNKLIEVPQKDSYKVTVAVVPEIVAKEFKNLPVVVHNLQSDLKIENIIPTMSIGVEGALTFVEKYLVPNNAVSINLSGITEPGEYEVPVSLQVSSSLKVLNKSFDKIKLSIVEANLDDEPQSEISGDFE